MLWLNRRVLTGVVMIVVIGQVGSAAATEKVPLGSLDLKKMSAGWGEPRADLNVVGKAMAIAGEKFSAGVGTHADSMLLVELDGKTERFTAAVGVNDETNGRGTVRFRVYGDGKVLFDSGVMKGGEKAKRVDVDLRGVKRFMLLADSAGDDVNFDHADWTEAERLFLRASFPPREHPPQRGRPRPALQVHPLSRQ